jgi:hypothetical protein
MFSQRWSGLMTLFIWPQITQITQIFKSKKIKPLLARHMPKYRAKNQRPIRIQSDSHFSERKMAPIQNAFKICVICG